MLRHQTLTARILHDFRTEFLKEFPAEQLRTWRSDTWRRDPLALANELEQLLLMVSEPDQVRAIFKALVSTLLLYKDQEGLWNVSRVALLLDAVSGAMSDWSGKRRHDPKRAAYDRRDKELWRRADVMHKTNDKLKATEIAARLTKPAVAKDFEKNGFLPPPSADRIRKIIATVFEA